MRLSFFEKLLMGVGAATCVYLAVKYVQECWDENSIEYSRKASGESDWERTH